MYTTTITIDKISHEVAPGVEISTFALNGTIPGPTIRVKPGDTMNVLFKNNLPLQPNGETVHNRFGFVDQSNLHWHGLHVSGELPSDDVLLSVGAGEEYQYITEIPDYHMPGTHWVHPHRHGSSAAQVGGGAAAALIVEDEPGTLPAEVENAPELLFIIQHYVFSQLNSIAQRSRDEMVWSAPNAGPENNDEFYVVNGKYHNNFDIVAGEWNRWRIIYAGWFDGSLDLELSGDCEMHLLAKDGIYIQDYPRSISQIPLAPGNRADIMVRCTTPSSVTEVLSNGVKIATLTTGSQVVNGENLKGWDSVQGGLQVPTYLTSLLDTPATEGCSCATEFEDNGVNGMQFDEHNILHTSYLGAIVERTIDAGGGHPYHQHLYPFQLVSGFRETEYNKIGDWQDTYLPDRGGDSVIRYQTTEIAGKMMLHCHRLDHEDQGMMGIEKIEVEQIACSCTELAGLSGGAIAGIVCGSIGLLLGIAFMIRRKKVFMEK